MRLVRQDVVLSVEGFSHCLAVTTDLGPGFIVLRYSEMLYASWLLNSILLEPSCVPCTDANLHDALAFAQTVYLLDMKTGRLLVQKNGKKGKFELANGGTIFLDEIADMPLTTLADRLREVERTTILEALIRNQFNFLRTAQELGISRGTLYNKTISLGIYRPGHG